MRVLNKMPGSVLLSQVVTITIASSACRFQTGSKGFGVVPTSYRYQTGTAFIFPKKKNPHKFLYAGFE
jgi:hypothetical protein